MSDKKAPRLNAARFALAEHKRVTHYATVEHGTEFAALLDPAYWTHVAKLVKPLDRIEAVAEDGSWFGELLVVGAGNNEVRTVRLAFVALDDVKPAEMETKTHAVEWRGPALWGVVRKADKAVLVEKLSKTDAVAWLKANIRTTA
jgi:hypothetical protein